MKKKFFSSVLLLAMVITTVGMFVSCKDYDDDISDLRNQITSNATDLQSLVDEKINNVTSEISSLQTQSSSLQSAYQAADAALQATLESSITSATTTANAYADVQAAQAQTASIAAAQELVDNAIASLQASLDEANATIATQGSTIASLLSADETLTLGMQTAQARADEAYDLAQNAYDLAQSAQTAAENAASVAAGKADASVVDALNTTVETLNTTVDALSTTVDGLGTTVDGLKESISSLETTANDAYAQAQENLSSIQGLQSQLSNLSTSNETILSDISELQKTVAANNSELTQKCEDLETEISANSADIATQQAAITKLQSDVLAAVTEAEAYADAVTKKVADDLADAVKGINTSIEELEKAYKDADDALQDQIDELSGHLDEVAGELEARIKVLEDWKAALPENIASKEDIENALASYAQKTEVESAISSALGSYYTKDEVDVLIQKLNDAINTVTNTPDFLALLDQVSADAAAIVDIQAELQTINEYLAYANQRLKNLVFAPTTYVNGIEAIMFTTLYYYSWSNTEADAPTQTTTSNYYVIDDEHHYEEYLINPKNVTMDGIEELTYISNTATNYSRVSTTAPITVTTSEIEDGVLKVELAKNVSHSTSFGTSDTNFTIVALKATLSDNVLTEDEKARKADGEDFAVYSDWARLYETSVRPYIHSTVVGNGEKQNGDLIETEDANSDVYPHYWSYSTMYDGGTKTSELTTSNNDKYLAAEVVYNESLDLTTLVEVCDKDGNTYDMDKFNLAWEFKLMPYLLKGENDATDATDQQKFAKLEGSIITSQSSDGEANNRSAIGRQPAIQVVLRDTKNDKIVDVRYFKIKWVDENQEPEVSTFGELGNFTDTYVCGDILDEIILERTLNSLYGFAGMTEAEFNAAYTLNSSLYATEADAKNAENPVAKLGEITTLEDNSGAGQTNNIQWEIDLSANSASQTEYEAGYKTITAYGYYQSNYNANSRIVFSVTAKINITKMALASSISHNESFINKAVTDCYINPQLDSDDTYGLNGTENCQTTMILSRLLLNYLNKNSDGTYSVPSAIDDLVNYGDASIIFDSSKLSSIASATGTSTSDWSVSSDGLTLKYKNVTAATIDANGVIQLYEDDYGSATSTPSTGAKLLVGNYAPVKLYDESCNWTQTIESYNVNFLTPLRLDLTDKGTIVLYDNTSGGSSSGYIYGSIEIWEDYTTNGRLVYSNEDPSVKSADITANDENSIYYNESKLTGWYGVGTAVMGTPMINRIGGTVTSSCDTPITDVKDGDKQLYNVVVDPSNWEVTFYNQSGGSLVNELRIEIPFTISTKWQDGMTAKIYVTIEPHL